MVTTGLRIGLDGGRADQAWTPACCIEMDQRKASQPFAWLGDEGMEVGVRALHMGMQRAARIGEVSMAADDRAAGMDDAETVHAEDASVSRSWVS